MKYLFSKSVVALAALLSAWGAEANFHRVAAMIVTTLLSVPIASIATESEKVGKPVGQMTYPMWQDGCILANEAAAGTKIATQVGAVIETKHGKWKCAHVIADQVTGKQAAAWVPVGK